MNRQGPGKIDWCDYTWNPVTGCYHGCDYCYARRIYERFGKSFEPAFHPQQLLRPGKIATPSKVFVCSVADLFGEWVPNAWIAQVMHVVRNCPHHTFQFLTKNPGRLAELNPWPANAWVGASVTNQVTFWRARGNLERVQAPVRFLSAEPLMGFVAGLDASIVDWLIIGHETGPGLAPHPPDDHVAALVDEAARLGVPVWLKDSVTTDAPLKQWPRVWEVAQ